MRDNILGELKQNLLKAQLRMKEQADKGRREVEFHVGDMVYLKAQPYKLKSLATRVNEKLSPRFYGPFMIVDRIGAVSYRLQLPATSRLHPVFHISQLKRALPINQPSRDLPPFLSEDLELQVEPETVLATRKLCYGDIEVLIKWTHLPNEDNTWEDFDLIQQTFPDFHLEDKVQLIGGGG